MRVGLAIWSLHVKGRKRPSVVAGKRRVTVQSTRELFDYHFISIEPHSRAGRRYVICDGDGVVVERIPVVGSVSDQARVASSRLGYYAALEA